MSKITVGIADDNALFREGLAMVLARQEDLQVVGTAADAPQAIALAETAKPDILLLDVGMPGLSGLDALPKIRGKSPHTKVLILSGLSGQEMVARALMYGARGWLTKTGTPEDLLRAIRAVHAEEIWASRRVLTEALEGLLEKGSGWGSVATELLESLTDREREVIRWTANGMTNKEIANQLGISDHTVKTHLSHIFGKLKVGRRILLHAYLPHPPANAPAA